MYYRKRNYTIPSDNRELQRSPILPGTNPDYTIPSDNRELQLIEKEIALLKDYTIPSDNRELQLYKMLVKNIPIIPYQVITGNYNQCF